MEWLLANFSQCYLLTLCGGIAAVALAESLWPRAVLTQPMMRRWLRNFALLSLDIGLVRLVFPLLGVNYALWVQQQGWGLLPLLELPPLAAGILAFVVLDFGQFSTHWLMHRVPWLWRLHRVHHSDRDYDFSTGLRFHPLEGVATSGLSLAVLTLLGAPVEAVAVHALVQVLWGSVAHANLHIPAHWERRLRRVVITPDLHRTHHSIRYRDSINNLGGLTPLWDVLFGSYQAQPQAGHQGIRFGLRGFEREPHQGMVGMLCMPFVAPDKAPAAQEQGAPQAGNRGRSAPSDAWEAPEGR